MSLSEFAIRSAKPEKKPYRMKDDGGLFLEIRPAGKKVWRMRYWISQKEGNIKLGEYPLMSLKSAREARDEARRLVAAGIVPDGLLKKKGVALGEDRKGLTFGDLIEEYLQKKLDETHNPQSNRVMQSRLNQYIVPFLGQMLPDEISAPILLNVIKRIEAKGVYETAHRTLGLCSQVFRYAIITGRASRDPSTDLRGALKNAPVKHHAAIINPNEAGALMRACSGYTGSEIVRIALFVTAYTFVRQKELRHMEWHEIDLQKAEWRIPGTKMKMKKPHIVPLAEQTMEHLKRLHTITGHGRYAFPNERTPAGDRAMSENTVNAALRRLGYSKEEMTAHGFRGMASTLLYESGKWSGDAIERQQAHTERNRVKSAYDHALHLPERREMMQWWADCFCQNKTCAKEREKLCRVGRVNEGERGLSIL